MFLQAEWLHSGLRMQHVTSWHIKFQNNDSIYEIYIFLMVCLMHRIDDITEVTNSLVWWCLRNKQLFKPQSKRNIAFCLLHAASFHHDIKFRKLPDSIGSPCTLLMVSTFLTHYSTLHRCDNRHNFIYTSFVPYKTTNLGYGLTILRSSS